jgi:Zn-dependent oligopeptidase
MKLSEDTRELELEAKIILRELHSRNDLAALLEISNYAQLCVQDIATRQKEVVDEVNNRRRLRAAQQKIQERRIGK